MPFGRVGFSPPKQRQTETTAKQRQAGRWAEAHPTASGNRPAFRHSVWKPENMAADAQNKEKKPIEMIQTASVG
ncbi:TPA: hypothetical protein ACFNMJ_001909 [Neisseria meningitidis]